MKKKYINILKRFFLSVVIGLVSITINLISCYFLFGNDGYKYEVIQYGNISNLILRIIYSSIFYFIIFNIYRYWKLLLQGGTSWKHWFRFCWLLHFFSQDAASWMLKTGWENLQKLVKSKYSLPREFCWKQAKILK